MLAPAVRRLAEAHRVLIVARRPERLGQVPGVVPVVGDWSDPAALAAGVDAVANEPIRLAFVWVHSPYRAAMFTALSTVLSEDAVVVHLLGSAQQDPLRRRPSPPEGYGPPRRYRSVVLGFTGQPGRTRWLTDEEISAGALAAAETDAPVQMVGRVSPWADRP